MEKSKTSHRGVPELIRGVARPLPLKVFQGLAKRTDTTHIEGSAGIEFPFLGLFGETGTLLSALKKKQRDGKAYVDYASAVKEEIGDVLWYTSTIASRAGIKLEDIASSCGFAANPKTFRDLESGRKSRHSEKELERALFSLAIKAGEVLKIVEPDSDFRRKDKDLLKSHLSRLLRSIIDAAICANVSIEEAAFENLCKIYDWRSPKRTRTPLFDRAPRFSKVEQFPYVMTVDFKELKFGDKVFVYQVLNDVVIGNALTDNKQVEDGYRFHDVFHLACAAILGWSPTMRALLKLKRKSDPKVDNSEDGQRAGFLEEGLIALIFQHALGVNCFKGVKKVDYSLLKLIPSFVQDYEVSACALWEWEEAILKGFEVFRQVRDHRGGRVVADLKNRTITYLNLPNNFRYPTKRRKRKS